MVIHNNVKLTQDHLEDAKSAAYAHLDTLDDSVIYHRKEHTTEIVVPAALKIAVADGFSLEDRVLVGIAAAFHDTGFVRQYNANEPIGAQMAEDYMRASSLGYTEEQIASVKDAIENTNMKNPPQTKYAMVLRDADLAVVGHPDFLQWNTDLKEECKKHPDSPMHEASLDDAKWGRLQLGFLSIFHTWFTQGARSLYEAAKQENIGKFKAAYNLG